jgi:hypothetical protein
VPTRDGAGHTGGTSGAGGATPRMPWGRLSASTGSGRPSLPSAGALARSSAVRRVPQWGTCPRTWRPEKLFLPRPNFSIDAPIAGVLGAVEYCVKLVLRLIEYLTGTAHQPRAPQVHWVTLQPKRRCSKRVLAKWGVVSAGRVVLLRNARGGWLGSAARPTWLMLLWTMGSSGAAIPPHGGD